MQMEDEYSLIVYIEKEFYVISDSKSIIKDILIHFTR